MLVKFMLNLGQHQQNFKKVFISGIISQNTYLYKMVFNIHYKIIKYRFKTLFDRNLGQRYLDNWHSKKNYLVDGNLGT